MKTIKPESIALFCLLSGDVDLAKHLAEILPITCFVGEDWQQDFQPLDGGPVQSLSDAYSDYSVLLLIAAESEISVPEWLAHSEGTTVILIAEHNARLLTGPAGGLNCLLNGACPPTSILRKNEVETPPERESVGRKAPRAARRA